MADVELPPFDVPEQQVGREPVRPHVDPVGLRVARARGEQLEQRVDVAHVRWPKREAAVHRPIVSERVTTALSPGRSVAAFAQRATSPVAGSVSTPGPARSAGQTVVWEPGPFLSTPTCVAV